MMHDLTRLFFLAAALVAAAGLAEEERPITIVELIAFDEDYKQSHLFRIAWTGDDRGNELRITEGDYSVLGFRISTDGARVAHHGAPSPLFDNRDEGEVRIMDADGGNALQLTSNTESESGAEPHGWGELRHELFKVNVEIDWFERHVRGIEYEWETAPESEGDEGAEEAEE